VTGIAIIIALALSEGEIDKDPHRMMAAVVEVITLVKAIFSLFPKFAETLSPVAESNC
jgi:hypothetical protein